MDPSKEISSIFRHAAEIVRQEGSALRSEFHAGRRGSGNNAVIDAEIEVRLRRRLLDLVACTWVGEENGRLLVDSPYRWIVDPHDGTRAYLEGLRGSSISVALVEDDTPILGIVYAPLAPDDEGDFFCWAKGGPIFRNGVALPPLSDALPEAIVIALNDRAGDHACANHDCYHPARILAIPSIAYRLALAAAGEVHVGLSLTVDIEDYDVAGGHALVHGAGGRVVQADGAEITYRTGRYYRGCIGGHSDAVDHMIGHHHHFNGLRVPRNPARPSSRIDDATTLRRVQGAMLGLLVGNALGAMTVWQSPEQVRARYPRGVTKMVDCDVLGTIAGQPTSAGETAVALARNLVAKCAFHSDAIGDAYRLWSETGPFDADAAIVQGVPTIGGRRARYDEKASSGGLVRAGPIGIFAAHDPVEAARIARLDSALTHPNPLCVAAAAALSAAMAVGIATGDRARMWEAALEHTDEEGSLVREVLQRAHLEPPKIDATNQGHVLIALQNAFYHLGAGTNFETAVIGTVSQGGASDVNGAIVGALIGAATGRDTIPLRWRQAVLSCRPVEARSVPRPRPSHYWPDDALDLAEALYAAGRVKSNISIKV